MFVIKNIIETIGRKTIHEFNPERLKNDEYNKLADLVRSNSDMKYISKHWKKTDIYKFLRDKLKLPTTISRLKHRGYEPLLDYYSNLSH